MVTWFNMLQKLYLLDFMSMRRSSTGTRSSRRCSQSACLPSPAVVGAQADRGKACNDVLVSLSRRCIRGRLATVYSVWGCSYIRAAAFQNDVQRFFAEIRSVHSNFTATYFRITGVRSQTSKTGRGRRPYDYALRLPLAILSAAFPTCARIVGVCHCETRSHFLAYSAVCSLNQCCLSRFRLNHSETFN